MTGDDNTNEDSRSRWLGPPIRTVHSLFSRLIGNAAGTLRIGAPTIRGAGRRAARKELASLLRPGDVLLEKTRFLVSDRLIPGHFGHAALWLGTAEELDQLGLMEKLKTHRRGRHARQLLQGRSVLEALRNGVQLNTLDHFLRVDEVAAVRWKHATDGAARDIAGVLETGIAHLGRAYDFEFELREPKHVGCSGLIYRSFPQDLPWPTRETFGHQLLRPDDVAVLAGPDDAQPFEVLYFHDGVVAHAGAHAWTAYWRRLTADGASLPPQTHPKLAEAVMRVRARVNDSR